MSQTKVNSHLSITKAAKERAAGGHGEERPSVGWLAAATTLRTTAEMSSARLSCGDVLGWRRAGRSALVTVIARGMCLGPPATRPCEPGTTLVPSFCEYRAQRATEKWLRPATDMQ